MAFRRKHLWSGNEHVPLSNQQYSLAIEWEGHGRKNVDLDLQAVIVNSHGLIVDAVYYNNLEAIDGAVGSHGDRRGGPGTNDEVIWVDLSKLPDDIHLIIFVVCAFKNHHLRDADNCQVLLMEASGGKNEIARCRIENSVADADVVGMMKRDFHRAWQFVEIDDPAGQGSHFLDIVEPIIGGLIRKQIPNAPKYQKVSFNMKKGGVVNLPGSSALKRLSITLDADVAHHIPEPIDIDIAAVFFDEEGNLLGAADSVNDCMFGVAHSGDTHFEEDQHIDESLSIDLLEVPEEVRHIFLVLTISHGTFKSVERLTTRILDQAAHDLAQYEVPAGHKESGLILARLFLARTYLSKRWALHAVGKFFSDELAVWSGHKAQREMLKILHNAHPDKVSLTRKSCGMPRQISGGSGSGNDTPHRQHSGHGSDLPHRQHSSHGSDVPHRHHSAPNDLPQRHPSGHAVDTPHRHQSASSLGTRRSSDNGAGHETGHGDGHGDGHNHGHGTSRPGSADSGAGHGNGHSADHGDGHNSENGAHTAVAHNGEKGAGRKRQGAGNDVAQDQGRRHQKSEAPGQTPAAESVVDELFAPQRTLSSPKAEQRPRKSATFSTSLSMQNKTHESLSIPLTADQSQTLSQVASPDGRPLLGGRRATLRKKGGLRLHHGADNPLSPVRETEGDAKASLLDSKGKTSETVLHLGTDETVPIAFLDEADVQRPWKRCDSCSWSQYFGFLAGCSIKS